MKDQLFRWLASLCVSLAVATNAVAQFPTSPQPPGNRPGGQPFVPRSTLGPAPPASQATQPSPGAYQPYQPPVAQQQIGDVAITPDGALQGIVQDAQGQPIPNTRVSLLWQGQEVRFAVTDANGQYRIENVRSGVHELQTVNHRSSWRLWAPGTAPPSAYPGIAIHAHPVQPASAIVGAGIAAGAAGAGGTAAAAGLTAGQMAAIGGGIVAAGGAAIVLTNDDDDASQ